MEKVRKQSRKIYGRLRTEVETEIQKIWIGEEEEKVEEEDSHKKKRRSWLSKE